MDSKEATSSPISMPPTGSSSSSSSYEFDIEKTVVKTNALSGDNNIINGEKVDISIDSSKSGASVDGGFESGQEEFEPAAEPDEKTGEKGVKEENSSDPFVGFVDSVEKVNKVDVLEGGEVVEGGKNGSVGRNELQKSIDDIGEVNKVGVLEGGEVVEGDNNGYVDRIELDKGIGEGNSGDPFAGSVDNSIVENVSVNDDVEKVNKVGVLEGGEVVEGDKDKEGATDRIELDSGDLEVSGTGGGAESKPEVPFDTENSGLNSYEKVEERGGEVVDGVVEVVKSTGSDKGEKNANLDDGGAGSVSEGKKVEEMEVKGEEAGEVEKVEASEGESIATAQDNKEVTAKIDESAQSGDIEKVNAEEVESTASKLVEADGLKSTSEGDSVVEAIEVELLEPGVAVVGEVEEGEYVRSKEVEVPVNESVALVDGNDVTSQLIEEVANSGAIGVEGQTSEPAADDNVETSESKPMDQKLDVAMAANQNINVEAVVPDVVVDKTDRNVEDDSAGRGATLELNNIEEKPEMEIEQAAASQTRENGTLESISVDGEVRNIDGVSRADEYDVQDGKLATETSHLESGEAHVSVMDDEVENKVSDGSLQRESAEPGVRQLEILEAEDEAKNQMDEEGDFEGSISDEETEGVIFGSSEAAKQFIEELERGSGGGSHSGAESSRDNSQRIDGQIVTDSDEEGDTDEEGDGRELFDSAALAALLKAATGADPDGGSITITSEDGSRLFSVERPAGLGSSIRSLRPAPRPNRSNLFSPTTLPSNAESENNLSEEEKKKLEKLQNIRVKYLRLLQRLGLSSDESIVNQVLYRLALVAGKQSNQLFSMDAAKRMALQLEAEGKDDLDFSVNILVLGKCGVGKSATINSIFGEEKATINAFEAATTTVKEISGFVDGVKIRVLDTPGLKPSVMEQAFNRSVLSSVKKFTKKTPLDIVLYVDRLDAPTRDLNDLPLLRTITSSLGNSTWRSAIVTLTHAASAPPDGPSGSPLSYEVFVTQRSHVVQQSIGQAVGDLRMMSPSLMNPVSLVENHPSCRKNREGQKVLPNGQSWRPQLLLLCYSMKILSEASSLSKPQDPFDHRKLFGFRARSPPLPYMLSSMLQSRPHPKLSAEQGGDNGDSDIDLDDLSDTDQEEEDEYDQLPPFKPLKKAQLAKLSNEQRKAYFEEYDYRVKLLQKKQWREELRRMREMKKKGKDAAIDYGYAEEDADSGAAAPVAVPLPDMALPPSFDSDYPAYRYRFLEPTSQFLARPVLDTHGWDHDCGYDGVNLEHSLAIASRFPASYTIQITKDKKDFTINVDSSISAKHGENGSSMAGFDIQSIGKQLAYIVRGETKFKNLKKNKTAGGISITFLGDNVVPGVKLEDQVILGKQYVLTGSAGAVRSQHDTAYGANFELQRREEDYPIGQVQSTLSMSVIKWRGDLALGFNGLAQFSIGRGSKVAVRAGINNKLSGQITVRTSSSDHLSLALAGIIPTAIGIYRKLWPDVGEKYSIY